MKFTIEDLFADGDKVVLRWTWQATHSGSFRGFAPTGQRVTNTAIVIYRLLDGKVVESWLEADRLGVLQAIGVVPRNLGANAR